MSLELGDSVLFYKDMENLYDDETLGRIVGIVPPDEHPQFYCPDGMVCRFGNETKKQESYLIKYEDNKFVFWRVKHDIRFYKRDTKNQKHIDKSDRYKLIGIAKLLGDSYVEDRYTLKVPKWDKCFSFVIKDGIEYIKDIYRIKTFA